MGDEEKEETYWLDTDLWPDVYIISTADVEATTADVQVRVIG